MSKIICNYYNECKHSNSECWHCTHNKGLNLSDYLFIRNDSEKTLKYLEKPING